MAGAPPPTGDSHVCRQRKGPAAELEKWAEEDAYERDAKQAHVNSVSKGTTVFRPIMEHVQQEGANNHSSQRRRARTLRRSKSVVHPLYSEVCYLSGSQDDT